MIESAQSYFAYYGEFLKQQWNNMSPMKYGLLLIFIAVFGFVLMRGGMKKV